MKNIVRLSKLVLLSLLATVSGGCSEDFSDGFAGGETVINATIADPVPESRSCIDESTLSLDFLGMMWEPNDKIGVYGTSDTNVCFSNQADTNAPKTTFSGQSTGVLQYAYFPWSEENNGVAVDKLKGTLPAEQTVYADYHIYADYKYSVIENGQLGISAKFNQLLSLARIEIDASGTDYTSERLQSVTFSATRDGSPVVMSGDFNFSAKDGSIDYAQSTGTTTAALWTGGMALGGKTSGFISMFPNIKSGDKLTVALLLDSHKLTFNVTVEVDFVAGTVYTFPLSLKVYQDNTAQYDWNAELVGQEYETVTGEFTCATLNVDGLPQNVGLIPVNKDGPGSDGTKLISQAVASTGWDFFAVSENFDYDTELKSAISSIYNSGTYRNPGSWASALTGTLDTDGLNLFWKKDGFSATNEKYVVYNDKEGGLNGGANTCIKKGFRHYEVTVAEGVIVDVYITHMNTYSGSGNTESNAYVKAQLSQLRQVRDYIVAKMKENKRPAIFMGDTNMRYTRHDIKTNLIEALTDGIKFNDPWVDFHRGGKFPEWNSESLMIRSKFNGDTTNDIVCSDDQRGEVVDKIWYFNYPGADVTLEALDLYNDVTDNFVKSTEAANYSGVTTEDENGNILTNQTVSYDKKIGLADHFPVVCKFKYTYKKPIQ